MEWPVGNKVWEMNFRTHIKWLFFVLSSFCLPHIRSISYIHTLENEIGYNRLKKLKIKSNSKHLAAICRYSFIRHMVIGLADDMFETKVWSDKFCKIWTNILKLLHPKETFRSYFLDASCLKKYPIKHGEIVLSITISIWPFLCALCSLQFHNSASNLAPILT